MILTVLTLDNLAGGSMVFHKHIMFAFMMFNNNYYIFPVSIMSEKAMFNVDNIRVSKILVSAYMY